MRPYFRAFHGPNDWGWIKLHLPLKRVEDTCGLMCIDLIKNETVAGCILDTWTHSSVQAHLVITNPLAIRHGFLHEVADYVYNVCEREVIVSPVPANKPKVLEFDRKLGFVERCRIPDGTQLGVDTVILSMHREQCKFWRPPLVRDAVANG